MTKKQYQEIMSLITSEEQWRNILNYFGIKSIWQLNKGQYEYTKKILIKRKYNKEYLGDDK